MAGTGHAVQEIGSARGAFVGAGLLAAGAALGIAIGALVDAPRLLLRRLQQPVQSVELGPAPDALPVVSEPEPAELAEFRALQEPRREPRRPPRVEAPRESEAPPARSAQPPAPTSVSAPPPMEVPTSPPAEQLIRAIAARRSVEPVLPPVPSSAAGPARAGERVVQVGAYGDADSARVAVDRLRGLGFDSYLSGRRPGGRYRVRVRPGEGRDADALAGELQRRGFSVWVTVE